jgi:hypothetical protein
MIRTRQRGVKRPLPSYRQGKVQTIIKATGHSRNTVYIIYYSAPTSYMAHRRCNKHHEKGVLW